METLPERSRTPCSTTIKRSSGGSNFRKGLGPLPSNTNWPTESASPNLIRHTASNLARDFSGDIKSMEIKSRSSEESVVDQTNFPEYQNGYKIEKDDPPGICSLPRGAVAEEKLNRLKELQRRRELTERYYSQEIRKLINEYYVTRNHGGGNSGDYKIGEANKIISPPRNPRILKALEPCGTMTTITRLDCGCMQETTRPIFTTPNGRVENRNCRHGQSPVLLKLQASEFNPQEHLSSLNFTGGNRRRITSGLDYSEIKHRPGTDSRRITESCGIDHSKRTQGVVNKVAGLRRPETASSSFIRDHPHARNLSPLRKYSDTSTD